MVDVKLNTLLKVYEMGSYTRAAEKLSLTQPAVSKHIRQLERELGVSIFDRTGPKLRLTPEGKLIVRYAERVIALSDGLRRALADRSRAVDRLRVGVTHTSESSIVAEVLARYTEENVNTRITLRTDALASLYEMLKSYQIDIAIVEGDVSYDTGNGMPMNNRTANSLTGDVTLSLLLDEAGNLKVKAFTRTIDRFDENQGLQESGLGISYRQSFDNFGDLIRNIKDRRQRRRLSRELRQAERKAAADSLKVAADGK